MSHRLLLDTSSLTYRAYFALPTSIKDPNGTPVNAVRGYLDMTARLITDLHPDQVVHVFDDDWRPAPRVEAYAAYKSTRRDDPEDLPGQFDVVRAVLAAFGQECVIAQGWEADDAIGALCAHAGDGEAIDVVTGDRDLLQLVRDGDGAGGAVVRVLFTVRGVSDLARFDEAAVQAKYGVPASRYVDFATLRGDPSDGLPGVKGVGEKTARALVNDYPDLHAMVRDAAAHPPRLGGALRDSLAYLVAMQQVVPVRTDVQVQRTSGDRDDARLDELAEQHNLEGPIRRLREALGA
ncbi:MAG: 5'-3' exonuclease [Euzebyaceae bacterium]|jgi:5'-3' exonuclease|nr:5'-3' exonuclease [Euzebyaceae bacterium]